MGKATDTAIAIIVLILGLWVVTRLGITLPDIEGMFKSFFFPAKPATNTSSGIVLALLTTTNSRIREKTSKAKEQFIRFLRMRSILNAQKYTRKGEEDDHR